MAQSADANAFQETVGITYIELKSYMVLYGLVRKINVYINKPGIRKKASNEYTGPEFLFA